MTNEPKKKRTEIWTTSPNTIEPEAKFLPRNRPSVVPEPQSRAQCEVYFMVETRPRALFYFSFCFFDGTLSSIVSSGKRHVGDVFRCLTCSLALQWAKFAVSSKFRCALVCAHQKGFPISPTKRLSFGCFGMEKKRRGRRRRRRRRRRTAYAAYTHGHSNKWVYLARVVEDCSRLSRSSCGTLWYSGIGASWQASASHLWSPSGWHRTWPLQLTVSLRWTRPVQAPGSCSEDLSSGNQRHEAASGYDSKNRRRCQPTFVLERTGSPATSCQAKQTILDGAYEGESYDPEARPSSTLCHSPFYALGRPTWCINMVNSPSSDQPRLWLDKEGVSRWFMFTLRMGDQQPAIELLLWAVV